MHFSSKSAANHDYRWTKSDWRIDGEYTAPARTLAPIYSNSNRDSLIYAFYNHKVEDKKDVQSKGHTKGVVAFDFETDSGFWLVHSVPNFPPPPTDLYEYPASGFDYGQSFLCLSLYTTQIETLAKQLIYNCPNIYSSRMSDSRKEQYGLMAMLFGGGRCSLLSSGSYAMLEDLGGNVEVLSFAKSKNFKSPDLDEDNFKYDLYRWVSFVLSKEPREPYSVTGLYTETWNKNGSRFPPMCTSEYGVLDIDRIEFTAVLPTGGEKRYEYPNSKDHSKFAVSSDSKNPWVCIGDLNRYEVDHPRGGGTVCLRNDYLWKVYSDMRSSPESCPT